MGSRAETISPKNDSGREGYTLQPAKTMVERVLGALNTLTLYQRLGGLQSAYVGVNIGSDMHQGRLQKEPGRRGEIVLFKKWLGGRKAAQVRQSFERTEKRIDEDLEEILPLEQASTYPADNDLENVLRKTLDSVGLKKALDQLSPGERQVIELRFYEGKTQEEIAKELGVLSERIRQIESKALRALRRLLG